MIKSFINLIELVIIFKVAFAGVRLFKGKKKQRHFGILGKVVYLIRLKINKTLDDKIAEQKGINSGKVIKMKEAK
jgi:hypothetical protein